MTNIKFIKATKNHSKIWVNLKHDAWLETYKDIYPEQWLVNFDFTKHEQSFINDLDNSGLHLYLIKNENNFIGYFCFGAAKHEPLDCAICLNSLYIVGENKG